MSLRDQNDLIIQSSYKPLRDQNDLLFDFSVGRVIVTTPTEGQTINQNDFIQYAYSKPNAWFRVEVATDEAFTNIVLKADLQGKQIAPDFGDGTNLKLKVSEVEYVNPDFSEITGISLSTDANTVPVNSTLSIEGLIEGNGNVTGEGTWGLQSGDAIPFTVSGNTITFTGDTLNNSGVYRFISDEDDSFFVDVTITVTEELAQMTLWDATTDPAPIYVYDQAAPLVVEAANDLRSYISQSSGKTVPVVEPQPTTFSFPDRCIKVGYPNSLTGREEIQIECLAIGTLNLTGVDSVSGTWLGNENQSDFMSQAGTYHAVMTFLHENIGVVFGFIGDIGTAVPSHAELKVAEGNKTHVPSAIFRNPLAFSELGADGNYGLGKDTGWIQKQRGYYATPRAEKESHGFRDYYERFHPDANGGVGDASIFALQPDNSRDGYPYGRLAKMEVGDPTLPVFWHDKNVEDFLAINPQATFFSCAFGDAHSDGHSVDPRAKAMDYPDQGLASSGTTTTITVTNKTFTTDEHAGKQIKILEGTNAGEERTISSNTADTITVSSAFTNPVDSTSFYQVQESDTENVNIKYSDRTLNIPTITDRELLFAKRCADELTANGHTDKFVITIAYGPTRIAPKRETADDRVVISNVANDFSDPNYSGSAFGQTHRQNMEDWLQEWDGKQIWRPNVGSSYSHTRGMYLTHVHQAMGRLKEIIPQGIIGFTPDQFWEHWSTQWPMYYVACQLLWDHTQDIDDILDKAYDTLFGNASAHVKAYYEVSEREIEENFRHGLGIKGTRQLWNEDILQEMQDHLTLAINAVTEGTDEHLRVEWVQTGLDWCKAMSQSCQYYLDYYSAGIITNETNRADLANAIETDVDGNAGWTGRFSDAPTSQSEVTNGSNFAFILNATDGPHLIATREDLPGVSTDMYVVTLDLKHSGTGGRWTLTLNGSGIITINSYETNWKTVQFGAYGGDTIEIRESNDQNDGIIYVDNFIVQDAIPVDQTQIESDWSDHNDAAVLAINDPKWDGFRPIGSAVESGGRIPFVGTDGGGDDMPPGLE